MPQSAVQSTHNDTAGRSATDGARRLRVVLCRTTHPGNIGATARAMKVMGVEDLVLVSPKEGIFPSEEATARAVSAEGILAEARVVETLAEAVADCAWVVGTTARLRHIGPPLMTPRDWAEKAVGIADQGVALVFGQERTGLLNEEIDHCHALIRIPTQEQFASLNLGSAVQILVYEWLLANGGDLPEPIGEEAPLATHAEVNGFLTHLRQVTDSIGFFERKNPDAVHRRLRALFGRASLDRNEINILRGLLRDLNRAIHGDENRDEGEEALQAPPPASPPSDEPIK